MEFRVDRSEEVPSTLKPFFRFRIPKSSNPNGYGIKKEEYVVEEFAQRLISNKSIEKVFSL